MAWLFFLCGFKQKCGLLLVFYRQFSRTPFVVDIYSLFTDQRLLKFFEQCEHVADVAQPGCGTCGAPRSALAPVTDGQRQQTQQR